MEDVMRELTDAEIQYLGEQGLGRLATVGDDGCIPAWFPSLSATTPRLARSTSGGVGSPGGSCSAMCGGRAWRRWWSTTCCRPSARVRSRGAAMRSRWTPAGRRCARISTTRSSVSRLAESAPGNRSANSSGGDSRARSRARNRYTDPSPSAASHQQAPAVDSSGRRSWRPRVTAVLRVRRQDPGVCQLSRSRTNQTQHTGHLALAAFHAGRVSVRWA